MDAQLVELFGRGSKEGVLAWLGDGTVLLNNVHKVGPLGQALIKQLLLERTYQVRYESCLLQHAERRLCTLGDICNTGTRRRV